MELLLTIIQIVIALGIFNVWLFRFGKSTSWRGGSAKNMKEEFEVYGFPYWFMLLIGGLKLIFAVFLIVGIWLPLLTEIGGYGIAILMLGAVAMHFKVNDPIKKSLPAFTLLVLSLIAAFFT
jgi:hypothetical protein